MLRTIFQSLPVIGGLIILSRHFSRTWQIITGVLMLVIGLIMTGVIV